MSLKRKTIGDIVEMSEISNLSKKCKLSDYSINNPLLQDEVVQIKSKMIKLPEKNKNRRLSISTSCKRKKEHVKRLKSSDTSDPHEYVLASPLSEDNFRLTISEVLISIDAIRKNKQRASLDKIYTFLIKDYPHLQMQQVNSIIDESIKLGTIEAHNHNGFCSYRKSEGRLEPISALPALDFTNRKDVLNAIKDLFQLNSQFSLDNIETLLMKKFNFYNVNGISLRKRLNHACNYLNKNGSLILIDNLYHLPNSSSANNEHNNNVATFNVEKIKNNNISNINSKNRQKDNMQNQGSLSYNGHCETSDKESHKNIPRSKNLELSLLFDSLTNFFTVSGDKRKPSRIVKQDSKIINIKSKFQGPKRRHKFVSEKATTKVNPLFIKKESKEKKAVNKIHSHINKKIRKFNKLTKIKSSSTQTIFDFDDKLFYLDDKESEKIDIIDNAKKKKVPTATLR